MHTLEQTLRSHRTLVLLGAGGVGKTTTAVTLAVAAAKLGRRAAVLSIDPARRLAKALGIEMGRDLKEVDLSQFEVPGTLHAAMIDQKAVFDAMIQKYAPSPKVEKKILNHSLYSAAANYLGGAIEFMALAQLQDMIESEKYDIVILDTPPAQHALDFLAKPNILAEFFDSAVTRMLLKPFVIANKFGLGRMMTFGEKMMGGLAKVAGVKSLEMLAEFMLLIQEVLFGFNKAGESIIETLKDERSGFLLVNAPRRDAIATGHSVATEIKEMGYALRGLMWNRDLSQMISLDEISQMRREHEDRKICDDLRVLADRVGDQLELFRNACADLHEVHPGSFVVRMPEILDDIHTPEKLVEQAENLLQIEDSED